MAGLNYVNCLQMILDAGADVNVQNVDGQTPLYYAVRDRSLECFKLLIDHKADVNLADEHGCSPLRVLPCYGSPTEEELREFCQILVNAGADLVLI